MSGKAALHASNVFAPVVYRLEAVGSSRLGSLWDTADQGQAASRQLAETLMGHTESCHMPSIHEQGHWHTCVSVGTCLQAELRWLQTLQ